MSKTFTLLAFLFISSLIYAQTNCDETSFLIPKEGEIRRTEITYGSNIGYFNNTLTLRADVYDLEPDSDDLRPLVVLAHGGGFVLGSRNDMRDLCEAYASLGYVCASIEYRLYPFFLAPFLDSITVVEVAFNAISDMKGAVRHFKRLADEENTFQIDPTKIIVGGLSAGAIMALHTGYLHEGDPIEDALQDLLDAKGGIEGNTGDEINRSYNSRVQAIISLSGATFDTLWITPDDPPIISMHGDADATLPYGHAREGAFNRVTLFGGSKIHERAQNIGLQNYFVGVPGGGHTNIYSAAAYQDYLADFNINTLQLMKDIACDELSVSVEDQWAEQMNVRLYPNPSFGSFFVETSHSDLQNWEVVIYDSTGNLVYQRNVNASYQLEVNDFTGSSGWYVVHTKASGKLQSAKILVVH